MRHELKSWPEFFVLALTREKLFDYRRFDRPFAVGDTVILQEWDPKSRTYTGRALLLGIKYVLHSRFDIGLPGNYCVLQY